MHTFTDPADGESYVSAYVGMDIAQRVFPCFDQNDLKAPIAARRSRAPGGWTVLANGRGHHADRTAAPWAFAHHPADPAADVRGLRRAVALGDLGARRACPFGWHARASLAAELDRDADELRAVTEACFDHYADVRRALPVRLLRPGLRARA